MKNLRQIIYVTFSYIFYAWQFWIKINIYILEAIRIN